MRKPHLVQQVSDIYELSRLVWSNPQQYLAGSPRRLWSRYVVEAFDLTVEFGRLEEDSISRSLWNITTITHHTLLVELRVNHWSAPPHVRPIDQDTDLARWIQSDRIQAPIIVGDWSIVQECLTYLRLLHSY
jgi:hypothetical protein